MRSINKITFVSLFFYLSLLVFQQASAKGNTYTTPTSFTSLLHNFYGKNESISSVLGNMTKLGKGYLVLFLNSDVYVYNSKRVLLARGTLRASPNSGFIEMTAVSHIGPALSYLLKLKQMGYSDWKKLAKSLLSNVKAVHKTNNEKNNWLQQLHNPAWIGHEEATHKMVNYACALSEFYIQSILNNSQFNEKTLEHDFLNSRSKKFPIPFNNVMIGTFMLTGMDGIYKLHLLFSHINIDWPTSRVILRNVGGSNFTAGLTKQSNWVYRYLKVESNNKLPDDRILIPAYAKVLHNVGDKKLSLKDYSYYSNFIWAKPFVRAQVVSEVFTSIPNIKNKDSSDLPGDYPNTKAGDIKSFLIRLKYSFGNPTQNLSNTVGFWLPGALRDKNWNVARLKLPGLEAGLPRGTASYP